MPLHRIAGNTNEVIVKRSFRLRYRWIRTNSIFANAPKNGDEKWRLSLVSVYHKAVSLSFCLLNLSTFTLGWVATSVTEGAVRLLNCKGVDPNSQDLGGKTLFSSGSSGGHRIAVEIVLKDRRVNIDIRDLDGQSWLGYSQDRNHEDVVELLLENKDIDIFGTVYNTSTVPRTPTDLELSVERLLAVQGRRPRVNLLAAEVRYLCLRAREFFMSQDVVLELEVPTTV